jgi:hypothetical protein
LVLSQFSQNRRSSFQVATLSSAVVFIGCHKNPTFFMFENDFLFFGVFSFSAILFGYHLYKSKANKQKKKGYYLYFIGILSIVF